LYTVGLLYVGAVGPLLFHGHLSAGIPALATQLCEFNLAYERNRLN